MNAEYRLIENILFVKVDFLLKQNVPFNTIKNGILNHKLNKSEHWSFMRIGRSLKNCFVNYETVPLNTINKYKLPNSKDAFLLRNHKVIKNDENKAIIELLTLGITNAYEQKWPIYSSLYTDKHFSEEQIILHAKTHSVFEEILQLLESRRGVKIQDIFPIYKSLQKSKFETESIKSFYRKINKAKRIGIKETLIHKATGNNIALKISKYHKFKLRELYKKGGNTYRTIHLEANLHFLSIGYNALSLSTVKAYLKLPEVQNRCDYYRHGKKYASDHLIPFLSRDEPTYSGDLWEIDSTKAQFMYQDFNGKIGFLCICFVEDIHSRKIVGFSIDETENHKMILRAIEKAVSDCGHFAAEIVHDNFSAYKTETFLKVIEKTKIRGVRWRSISLGNSKDNGHVERLVGTFQTVICKSEHGYIGEGIKSKRKDAFPSPENLEEFRKESNLRNKKELVQLLENLVEKYNDTGLEGRASPNHKFQESKKKNAINIPQHDYARFFWQEKINTVENSMIIKQVESVTYTFTIWNTELSERVNRQKVLLRYDPKELDYVFIYDVKSDEYLGIAEKDLKIPCAYINREEEHNKGLSQFIRRRKEFIDNSFSLKGEELTLIKDHEKYDYTVLNSPTSRKEIRDETERNYILKLNGIDGEKIRKENYLKGKPLTSHNSKNKKIEQEIIPTNIYSKPATLKILNPNG